VKIGDTHIFSLIGGGMSGTLLAILLARRGIHSEIWEGGADPRRNPTPATTAAPRPAMLALGERGRHALRAAGLEDAVGRLVTPMRGRMIHNRRGQTTLQPYGIHAWEALYSIRRDRLIGCLLDAAEATGKIRIEFGRRLRSVDFTARTLRFESGEERNYAVLVGADGPRSAVRRALQKAGQLEVSESLLDVGWKGLSVPPAGNGGPRLDNRALHVWPRGGYMMIAMPDTDGHTPAMLFLPVEGDPRMPWGFAELDSWTRQQAFMASNFPDAGELIPDLEQQFRDHPVGRMGTVRCDRWHLATDRGGPALLIGDAAHCIVPFHGQGVNAAFEDCTALMDIIDGGAADWDTAFERLHAARRADAEAIADMALDAYRVMRDAVRHRDFMLRKALERELERRHPGLFVPRYSLVMFHRIPYAEAHRRGRLQADILDDLLHGKQQLAEVDLQRAARLVEERLAPVPTA
jgi:kynurenine 3-monooxygenase